MFPLLINLVTYNSYLQIMAKTQPPGAAIQVTWTSLCTHLFSLLQSARFTDFIDRNAVHFLPVSFPPPASLHLPPQQAEDK